jgi:hypothetical protein
MMTPETLISAAIAISFAAGLNVYATMLGLGIIARLHWATLPGGLDALSNVWVMAACGLLFSAEFFADKIPGFDLIWNAAHTFVRLPLAALLAYQVTAHLPPLVQAGAAALGATIAGVAHGSKIAIRAAVTPSPEPVSNIALSSGEDAVALGLTWAATAHPLAAGVAGGLLTLAALVAIWFSVRLLRRMVKGFGAKRWSIFRLGSAGLTRSASSSKV